MKTRKSNSPKNKTGNKEDPKSQAPNILTWRKDSLRQPVPHNISPAIKYAGAAMSNW